MDLREIIARAQHMEWPVDGYEAVPLDEIFPTPRPRYIFLANTYFGRADAAIAAIDSSGTHCVVPLEPTEEMADAAHEAWEANPDSKGLPVLAARNGLPRNAICKAPPMTLTVASRGGAMAEPTIKARRLDPRDEETIDLKYFETIEIVHGYRRLTIRLQRDPHRICISADDRLTIQPVGANWIDVLL